MFETLTEAQIFICLLNSQSLTCFSHKTVLFNSYIQSSEKSHVIYSSVPLSYMNSLLEIFSLGFCYQRNPPDSPHLLLFIPLLTQSSNPTAKGLLPLLNQLLKISVFALFQFLAAELELGKYQEQQHGCHSHFFLNSINRHQAYDFHSYEDQTISEVKSKPSK